MRWNSSGGMSAPVIGIGDLCFARAKLLSMRQTRNGSHRLGLSEGGEGHEMELKGEAAHLYRDDSAPIDETYHGIPLSASKRPYLGCTGADGTASNDHS